MAAASGGEEAASDGEEAASDGEWTEEQKEQWEREHPATGGIGRASGWHLECISGGVGVGGACALVCLQSAVRALIFV
jgi:hypothetical protein